MLWLLLISSMISLDPFFFSPSCLSFYLWHDFPFFKINETESLNFTFLKFLLRLRKNPSLVDQPVFPPQSAPCSCWRKWLVPLDMTTEFFLWERWTAAIKIDGEALKNLHMSSRRALERPFGFFLNYICLHFPHSPIPFQNELNKSMGQARVSDHQGWTM